MTRASIRASNLMKERFFITMYFSFLSCDFYSQTLLQILGKTHLNRKPALRLFQQGLFLPFFEQNLPKMGNKDYFIHHFKKYLSLSYKAHCTRKPFRETRKFLLWISTILSFLVEISKTCPMYSSSAEKPAKQGLRHPKLRLPLFSVLPLPQPGFPAVSKPAPRILRQ